MRLLATLKPEWYERPDHAYGVLADIDWRAGRVLRSLKIPSASFRHADGFMAPLTGGVCAIGSRVFMAMWNFIVEVDYERFEVVNAVSHPWMADLHGLTTDGERIWAVASSVEAVLCLDAANLELLWRWGPDAPILERDRPPGFGRRPLWDRIPWLKTAPKPITQAPEREHRGLHKSRSPYRRHHVNDIRHHNGDLYITTFHWFNQRKGAVIRLDPETRQAEFFVKPGGFDGTHDGLFDDGRYVVTEARANGVAWREADGTLIHKRLAPEPFFVRGLCALEDTRLVGFTRLRQAQTPSWIIAFDRDFERERGRLDVSGFYPQAQGCAVHALAPAPG